MSLNNIPKEFPLLATDVGFCLMIVSVTEHSYLNTTWRLVLDYKINVLFLMQIDDYF